MATFIIEGANAAGMERCLHYNDKEELAQALLCAAGSGDALWFKASRGMKLEEVIERFYEGGK